MFEGNTGVSSGCTIFPRFALFSGPVVCCQWSTFLFHKLQALFAFFCTCHFCFLLCWPARTQSVKGPSRKGRTVRGVKW